MISEPDQLWLNGEVGQGAGDVPCADGYGPTDTSVTLLNQIEQDRADGEASLQGVDVIDGAAFHQVLAGKGAIPLATAAPDKSGAE